MQVDSSIKPLSAIQAFNMDPSTKWVIKSTPGFIAIKHKMGCPICNTSMSHFTIKDLEDQVHTLEKQLQETKDYVEDNSTNEELDYYVGRAHYALYRKD
ncbi:hypothetical protein M422DRAFT_264974 [Sphaerobolus stellatus SS14]|uniref:Uncharacterized protein n=1 Tax=Sphaerobolus stellatus (strain SS14) TaxID=990650 RepID=A0A0C9UV04_SPHS4|nr:hypothetical protein M422DRAFT_264974 [Sphaerobolus stellatus SS14]